MFLLYTRIKKKVALINKTTSTICFIYYYSTLTEFQALSKRYLAHFHPTADPGKWISWSHKGASGLF